MQFSPIKLANYMKMMGMMVRTQSLYTFVKCKLVKPSSRQFGNASLALKCHSL